MPILKSIHRFSIGYRSRLGLTIEEHLLCTICLFGSVFRSIVMLKMNLLSIFSCLTEGHMSSSRFWMCLAESIFHSILINGLVPSREKHPHNIMLPSLCFTVGMMYWWWCAVFGFHQIFPLEFSPKKRPDPDYVLVVLNTFHLFILLWTVLSETVKAMGNVFYPPVRLCFSTILSENSFESTF